MLTYEKLHTQEVFELADLAADRRRRHVQLLGRQRNALQPTGGFECAYGMQGW
jgi:hypothetical protein